MIKNLIYVLAIAFTFSACSKKSSDPTPVNNGSSSTCYVTSSTTDGVKDFDGTYNSNNLLDSVKINTPQGLVDYKLIYNSNKQLIKTKAYFSGIEAEYTNIHYNTNGKRDLDTIYTLVSPGTFIADSINKYTYNSSNQIIRVDNINIKSNPSSSFTTYTYDALGNLSSETNSGITLTYTYDNKKGGLISITSFLLPVYGNQMHNIISQTQTGDTPSANKANSYTAVYTFNSNSYPITEVDTYLDSTPASPNVSNVSYTYNCK